MKVLMMTVFIFVYVLMVGSLMPAHAASLTLDVQESEDQVMGDQLQAPVVLRCALTLIEQDETWILCLGEGKQLVPFYPEGAVVNENSFSDPSKAIVLGTLFFLFTEQGEFFSCWLLLNSGGLFHIPVRAQAGLGIQVIKVILSILGGNPVVGEIVNGKKNQKANDIVGGPEHLPGFTVILNTGTGD